VETGIESLNIIRKDFSRKGGKVSTTDALQEQILVAAADQLDLTPGQLEIKLRGELGAGDHLLLWLQRAEVVQSAYLAVNGNQQEIRELTQNWIELEIGLPIRSWQFELGYCPPNRTTNPAVMRALLWVGEVSPWNRVSRYSTWTTRIAK